MFYIYIYICYIYIYIIYIYIYDTYMYDMHVFIMSLWCYDFDLMTDFAHKVVMTTLKSFIRQFEIIECVKRVEKIRVTFEKDN